ncbi:MAG: hypothetical protein H0T62_04585 [Parachlamydiaceae bacterium]|nr:hypothetical protein [Parachlamydiaceae bacterium]
MEPFPLNFSYNPHNRFVIPPTNPTNDSLDNGSIDHLQAGNHDSPSLKLSSSFPIPNDLSTFDENKISFSNATHYFEKIFLKENAVWIHGKSERLRNVICEKYIDEHSSQYQGNIYWINAEGSSNAFIRQMKDLGLKIEPKWKSAFPENYPQAFESHFEGKPYLIILNGVTINHWTYIVEFLKEGRGDNHHFFISSKKLLNERSIVIVEDEKQEISIENIKKKNPLLTDSLRILSLLSYHSLDQNVLKMICPNLRFEDLKSQGLIRGNIDSFSIHQDVIESFLQKPETSNAKLLDTDFDQLVELFRKILDSPLRTTDQEWAIPHILTLFERLSNLKDFELKKKSETLVTLGSMVLDIGHFYSQNGDPIRAQEVTWLLKDMLDRFIKQNTVVATDFKKIHPHLPYLYLNTLYQLGRLYFYCKISDEELGSLALLTHAKNLCEKIMENGKKPLLLMLIERNGLLFHLKENKQFEEVVVGYKKLKNLPEIYFEVDYKQKKITTKSFKEDYQHQATCLKYMIDANLELHKYSTLEALDQSIEKEVLELQNLIPKLSNQNQVDSWIYLSKLYLKQDKIDSCLAQLFKIFSEATPHQQLAILKTEISCYEKRGKSKEAAESAMKYRKIAENYYSEGQREIYDTLVYEWEKQSKDWTIESLGNFDRFLRNFTGQNDIGLSHYCIQNSKFIIKSLHSTEKVKDLHNLPDCISVNTEGNFEIHFDKKIPEYFTPVQEPIPEKKEVSSPTRITMEIIQEDRIILDAGEGRKLTLAKPLADFIKMQGDWKELKETLALSADPALSPLMTSQRYRLFLDRPQKSVENINMDNKIQNFFALSESDESWSDDNLEEDELQECFNEFLDKEQSLQTKNEQLYCPKSSYPKFLSENIASKKDLQKKAEETKKIATKKLAAEINIPRNVNHLTESFVKEMKQEESTNLREYVKSYIENKNAIADAHEDQQESKGYLKLKKVEQELNWIKEREAYLKLKQEKLIKKRVKIFAQKKVERSSYSPKNIEELQNSLQAAEQLPLVIQARPIELMSDKIQEHQKSSGLLHFSCPHAFIYHTLKHQSPPPFTFEPEGPAFSLAQFEKNAQTYLTHAREIVGKEAKIVCSIPDQFSASKTNFRYLKFPISSEEMKRLLFLEREIQKNDLTKKKLEREKSNNILLSSEKIKIHEEEIERIKIKVSALILVQKQLEKERESLYNKFKEDIEVKCDFVSLSVKKYDNNRIMACFLTHFSDETCLNKLPIAEIVLLNSSDMHAGDSQ